MTWRSATVLALIAHKKPFANFRLGNKRVDRCRGRTVNGILFGEAFNKLYMAPVVCRKVFRIVITVPRPMIRVRFQLVPLLTGYLAGFTTCAYGGVCEKCQLLTFRKWIIAIKQTIFRIDPMIFLRLVGRVFFLDDVKDIFGIDGSHD